MKKRPQIIIVEDNPMYRELLALHLQKEDQYEIQVFPDAASCMAAASPDTMGLLLDYHLTNQVGKEMNGLELLRKLRLRGITAPALFLTGNEKVQSAAEILKEGVYDYLQKGKTDIEMISEKLSSMIAWYQLETKRRKLKAKMTRMYYRTLCLLGIMVGVSAVLYILSS